MKNNFPCKIVALAVAGGVWLSAASALAAGSDAFNRLNLGPSWVIKDGSLSISNDELVGASLSLGYLKSSSTNTAATAVVFLGGNDLEYGAVALGNIGAGQNAFVKIQAQNGVGTFDHAAFYTGDNAGSVFFTLASTVPSPAILDVFFCGTTAVMRITSAAGVQTYTNNYGSTFGPGGGLGTYGSVRLDNYISWDSGSGICKGLSDAVPAVYMPRDTDKSPAH